VAKKLTARSVEQARADPAKRREIPDALLSGLHLVIQPSGAKSWAVRYRHAGTPRKLTLGPYPVFSLSEARTRAREMLQAVGEGRDPAAEKRATRRRSADRDLVASVVHEYQRRYVTPNNRPS
jgi:Arm domain-containing DNA-binding protein